ncbi:MAG: hypothetical protein NC300_04035 [Bacteroidales bacterium]|nr:hypothetical protein [Clostridium sp.]MCM1203291.1 hypothetical protein [Bacteroidales bacterium]
MNHSKHHFLVTEMYYLLFILYCAIIKIMQLRGSTSVIAGAMVSGIFALLSFGIKSYTKREWINIFLLIILGMILIVTAGIDGFIITAISIVCLKHIDLRRIFKYLLVVCSILFFTIVIMSLAGIIKTDITTVNRVVDGSVKEISKNSLGFLRPNATYRSFFILVLLYYYLKYYSLKIVDFVVTILLASFFFYETECRTGFFCTVIFVVLVVLFKYLKLHTNKVICEVVPFVPIAVFAFSFVSASRYTGSSLLWRAINELLSNRLHMANVYLKMYRPKMFGQYLLSTADIQEYLVLDNGYLQMLLGYGVIVTILFLVSTFLVLKKMIRNGYIIEMILILIFCLYGFSEALLLDSAMNFSLMFYSSLLFKDSVYNRQNCNQVIPNIT